MANPCLPRGFMGTSGMCGWIHSTAVFSAHAVAGCHRSWGTGGGNLAIRAQRYGEYRAGHFCHPPVPLLAAPAGFSAAQYRAESPKRQPAYHLTLRATCLPLRRVFLSQKHDHAGSALPLEASTENAIIFLFVRPPTEAVVQAHEETALAATIAASVPVNGAFSLVGIELVSWEGHVGFLVMVRSPRTREGVDRGLGSH